MGLSVEGARLAPNNEDNHEYYGQGVNAKDLLFGNGPENVPQEADEFRKLLP